MNALGRAHAVDGCAVRTTPTPFRCEERQVDRSFQCEVERAPKSAEGESGLGRRSRNIDDSVGRRCDDMSGYGPYGRCILCGCGHGGPTMR